METMIHVVMLTLTVTVDVDAQAGADSVTDEDYCANGHSDSNSMI